MAEGKTDLIAAHNAIGKDVKIIFTRKFKHEGGKGDKGELKILAITPYRIYVVTTKHSPKVEYSFHILEIYSLDGSQAMSLNITIQIGDKQHAHRYIFENEDDVGKVIAFIIALLRTNFMNAHVENQVSWNISSPEKREYVVHNTNLLARSLSGEAQPACGSFTLAYLCVCDYYKQTSEHTAEVIWDIDKIYASHRCKDFKLIDFERLDAKDLIPLIATLAYNTWFTCLSVSSLKLSNEIVDVIIKVIRRSLSIEEIILTDCHVNKDQIQKIALAIGVNPNKVVKRLNFSKNNLEDKGVNSLTASLGTLQNGMESINLSEIGMSTKGTISVANCLKNNKLMSTTLTELVLSGNQIKLEGIQCLCEFFSQPNALVKLDLSNTECPIDLLFTALHRGCQLSLEVLDISGNPFSSKKSKDNQVSLLSSVQQFFSMSRALKTLNLSNTKIPANGVKAILVGLLNNPVLNDVDLDLSNNELKSNGAAELTSCLKEISLSRLNLANNGLEQDLVPICEALQSNRSIKELDFSHNLTKAKKTNDIAEALGELLISETPLTKLSVADCKLRVEAAVLFDCLGTNETLTSIDIRGNSIGDTGARMFAKALQINTKLREIQLDRNNITPKGLQDIAQGMERNYSLHSMPLPTTDLAASMKQNTSTAFIKSYSQIEQALMRNQSHTESKPDQVYKVHQALLISSIDNYTHQTDECVTQLEDTISRFQASPSKKIQKEIKVAGTLMKEADLFRQVLLEIYSDPEHTKSLMEDMFNKVNNDIVNSVECVIKENIDKMLTTAAIICPTALNKEEKLNLIKEEILKSSEMDKVAISNSIMDLGKNEITYKLHESNLGTATSIAEQLKKLFVDVLQNSINTLSNIEKVPLSPDIVFETDQNKVSDEVKTVEEHEKTDKKTDVVDSPLIMNTEAEIEDIIPPISSPVQKILDDISINEGIDLSFEFKKPLDDQSSIEDDDAVFRPKCRSRLETVTSRDGRNKKKKGASLKRRPTFYKEMSTCEIDIDEIEIPIEAPCPEKTSDLDDTPLKIPIEVPSLVSAELENNDEINVVDIPEQQSGAFVERKKRSSLKEQSKSVDYGLSSQDVEPESISVCLDSKPSRLQQSLSMDNALDEPDSGFTRAGRLPSIRAFDDVSTQSSQLTVKQNRPKPMRGRRAPTRVSQLAHMSSSEDVSVEFSSTGRKPRPKSEMPQVLNPLFEEMIRPRGASSVERKRDPPARPNPPTKPETPTRPDPPLKVDKVEPPVRPERPKKPDKSETTNGEKKEKKVKPPSGAFQLPPIIGGLLKKRNAPKIPDSVDGASSNTDSPSKGKSEISINTTDASGADHHESSKNEHSEAAPPKPPPPTVLKKHAEDVHSSEPAASPVSTGTPEHAVTAPKKPIRGIPMGGSAFMADLNKKLHKTDETKPPTTAKPQKPAPPQRPPSLKRANTAEGRPNVPDRPKVMQKSKFSDFTITETKPDVETERNGDIEETSPVPIKQTEEIKPSEESHNHPANDDTKKGETRLEESTIQIV